MLLKSHRKQTESAREPLGRSNTAGERRGGTAASLATEPAANPTRSLIWKREPPRPELWFPICISTLLAKAPKKVAEKPINVDVRPKAPPKGDGGMAAVPWGNPSVEKTKGESQSPCTPCRYPTPGLVGVPAPPTHPQPPLVPGDHPRVLPHHPVPSSCLSLPRRAGGCWGQGCFCPSVPATSLSQSQRAQSWILPWTGRSQG